MYNIPGRPTVRPRDSILPVICHLAPENDAWRDEVMHWVKISRHLYYYTYVGYRLDFPRFDIVEDIRWCHDHKGIAMYLEHDAFTPVNMLTMYLGAKALWDADVDTETLLAEFYQRYYGTGADPMRRFYETFHRLTEHANEDYDSAYRYPEALDSETVGQCRELIAAARRRATQPVVERRLDAMQRYWRATELHVAAQEAMARWQGDRTEAHMQATREAYTRAVAYVGDVADEFAMQGRIALLNHEGYNADLAAMNAWEKELRSEE
jgi:hypothetical protein